MADLRTGLPLVFHDQPCCVCGETVPYVTVTNADPECPELFSYGVRASRRWFGLVREDDGRTSLIACCSDACAQRFVSPANAAS